MYDSYAAANLRRWTAHKGWYLLKKNCIYLPLSLSLPCRTRRGKRLAEEREGRERGEVRGSWTLTIASNHPTAFLGQRAPYRQPTGHHAISRHFYIKFLIFNF